MITTILFDFDGTIADTLLIAGQILQEVASKYGYKPLTVEESQKMRDYSIDEICEQLHVPLYRLPFLFQEVRHRLADSIQQIKPINGIEEQIIALKENGYRLAIITSNNEENVERFLASNHLQLFDTIYTGTSLFGKARVIKSFLKKYQLLQSQVVYIGDEIRDVKATKEVGIPMIAVSWGLNSKKGLKRFVPEYIVDRPEEIIRVLLNFS